MRLKLLRNQQGSLLIPLIIVVPMLLLILASYMDLNAASFKIARRDQQNTHAQFAVDAGVEVGVQEINADNAWLGTTGQIDLHNDGTTRTTYEVTVADNGADNKTMTVIGRAYRPTTSASPESTVHLEINLRAVRSGLYSVVSGVGGLIMSNSAKILGGDVFINGKVTLSNSAQIGLITSPVNLSVAHQSCPNPPNATYPVVCNSGQNGQPITLNNTSHIYGTVKANNQTNTTNITNPGLQSPYCLVPAAGPNCVTPEPLPPHDRDAQKAAISSTVTGASAGCSSGTKTWAANLKITGDVVVSNSCKITVEGNVWITGSLEVKNSAELIVSNSLGATRPVIMIDGLEAEFSNSSVLRSNSSNTGFQIITYKSDAACSPDCADVTGVDLFNSQGDTTIQLDNSASGPNTIFYARWTKVRVSNSGQIGALVGQTVELTNSGTITFGTSTGTGTVFWIIDGYRRVF